MLLELMNVLMCMSTPSIPKPVPPPPPPPPPSPPAPIANVATKTSQNKVATASKRKSAGKSRFRTSSSAPTGLNIG